MPPLLSVSAGVPITVTGAVISTVGAILSPENSVPLPGAAEIFCHGRCRYNVHNELAAWVFSDCSIRRTFALRGVFTYMTFDARTLVSSSWFLDERVEVPRDRFRAVIASSSFKVPFVSEEPTMTP